MRWFELLNYITQIFFSLRTMNKNKTSKFLHKNMTIRE